MIKDIEEQIAALQAELTKAKHDEDTVFIANNSRVYMATFIHVCYCNFHHEDVCDWYYGSIVTELRSSHKEYLQRADAMEELDLDAELSCRIVAAASGRKYQEVHEKAMEYLRGLNRKSIF